MNRGRWWWGTWSGLRNSKADDILRQTGRRKRVRG